MSTGSVEVVYRGIFQKTLAKNICRGVVFAAKKDGKVNHCFQCGDEEEADGVKGILGAYRQAFKSGIAMSSPTNITEVVQKAGKTAGQCLVRGMRLL